MIRIKSEEDTGIGTARYAGIDEVVAFIQQHLYEPLPLSRLAGYASYSPFHFTRIFKERMGLSPLYYVSSLRLQMAKDLLLRTGLSIRDVGLEIGQQSLGTFTTRFTERVGMTPAEFRNSRLQADSHLRSLRMLDNWRTFQPPGIGYADVEGTIRAEVPFEGIVLVGLFAKPIPEGVPQYGTLLSSPGKFRLPGVRPGTYYLMSTSIPWGMQALDVLLPHNTLRARSLTPIVVRTEPLVPHQHLTLRAPRLDDPPILVSIPLLMDRFLRQVRESRNR
ncbi:helix-turn-helix domain-containing protein [Paenibacillus humicola]|uniref:helix-turn-helix domain-containing protein n=1 Tax=Paenibacillus humicola TaxID=3110540 RepID=UPI00237BF4B0|nr:helix-turn-helix domain-containing protein [Paenibacillus humicola]